MQKILFGHNLKQSREEAKLTQQQVADAVGVKNKQTVSAWENGLAFPQVAELINLSKVLNVSIDWLLGNSAGFLKGLDDQALIDILSDEKTIPGEWHVPQHDEDESAGDLNEHNALVFTANVRKFMQRVGIDPTFENDLEAFVGYLRFKSLELKK